MQNTVTHCRKQWLASNNIVWLLA